ncbi:ABC transporter ATP-binding protein [Sediminispirochaeta bajacaliforniensis]|uniref:ABC transporter ATP-binding protein n=1 Tax=Sediminispirochaeta bajacaliforniensis TaxID=148 RepID=UPI000379B2F7|nr:ABC transporter ATP-binding protein [Sediminispirochaeta bajacaliforniensis]
MKQNDYLMLKNLVKDFHDGRGNTVRAVDDISLSIAKGDFVTLLGPSGCGKTTTLRMVAGFEVQSTGDIILDGRKINTIPAFDRNMPMVFQSYALFPHLTIFENIAYGLKIRKIPKEVIKNDVALAAQMVNLVGLEDRYPGELSGGQQQRVALARALVLKPEIILFDEPLSNLDAKLRIQTRTEIKRVQQLLGITALYVTHDQSEALSISDTIVIMNNGKIVQSGSPEEIYNHPADPFVSDFIGNANFFDGVVTEIDSRFISVSLLGSEVQVPLSTAGQSFLKGDEVVLAIKPEAVEVRPGKGAFNGKIEVSSFLGATTEYKIEYADGFMTAITPNTQGEIHNYRYGQEIAFSFKKEFFRIYKR